MRNQLSCNNLGKNFRRLKLYVVYLRWVHSSSFVLFQNPWGLPLIEKSVETTKQTKSEGKLKITKASMEKTKINKVLTQ